MEPSKPAPGSLQEEIKRRKPFEVIEQETYLSVMRTASVLDADFERFYRGFGLSIATFNVLRILRGAGEQGRMCHEIREHMVARVPDITRFVDRLEAAGLAERSRSSNDRRVVYCKITRKGLELLASMDAKVLERHREQLGHLSKEELQQLCALLLRARQSPRVLERAAEDDAE
jgi:DNA-binding MarR family transcriptional regulator